jgi:hypothetical protein
MFSNFQGSPTMTRLANVGQGGRITARSTASNGVSESTIATLLSHPVSNHQNLVNPLNSPSARKRKLPLEDYVVLRRKVSDNHTLRLRRLQVRYAEHCALLCFFQGNGQPADYSAWRSRLPPVTLNNFLRLNKLNPSDENEDLLSILTLPQNQSTSNQSHIRSAQSKCNYLLISLIL